MSSAVLQSPYVEVLDKSSICLKLCLHFPLYKTMILCFPKNKARPLTTNSPIFKPGFKFADSEPGYKIKYGNHYKSFTVAVVVP